MWKSDPDRKLPLSDLLDVEKVQLCSYSKDFTFLLKEVSPLMESTLKTTTFVIFVVNLELSVKSLPFSMLPSDKILDTTSTMLQKRRSEQLLKKPMLCPLLKGSN